MAEKKEKQYVIDNVQLMAEWNCERKDELGIEPRALTLNSHQIAWWRCCNGHEWKARIADKNRGNGCPYCSGRYAIKGKSDLQTVNPSLAKEWSYEKNGDLRPEHFTPNSNKKVWWKCSEDHEWRASINSRNYGCGCPYCSGRVAIKGKSDLQTVNPIIAKEWHYEKNGDLRPEHFTPNSNKKVWWKCSKGHEWQSVIKNRSKGRGCPICGAERNTSYPEYAVIFYLEKYGLETIHTYKENGYELDIFIPSKRVAVEYDGSYWHECKTEHDLNKNFWCKKNGIKLYRIREGLESLNDSSLDYVVQTKQKDLSEILKKVLSEIIGMDIDVDLKKDAVAIENLREFTEKNNSILFLNPKLAKEWNYEKNGKLKPEHFAANSNKQVWWMCDNGHEWQASIANRNKGRGCPYCACRKVLKGFNDLQTTNPELAKEWNHEKNGKLKAEHFTATSSKQVWWMCDNGHEWQASIANRNKGRGCPYCSGRKSIEGYNDLQTVNPILVKEWNYERNNGLTPTDVLPHSNKNVWWKCQKGHEWKTSINNRTNGTNCQKCEKEKRKKTKTCHNFFLCTSYLQRLSLCSKRLITCPISCKERTVHV